MNHSQHDELAALFAQSMTFTQTHPQDQNKLTTPAVETIKTPTLNNDEPVAFASTHYNHSTHLGPSPAVSVTSRSPPPSYVESVMSEEMAQGFRQHSIDPTALLPNQITLFLNADYEQKLRLLELWRISPPSYLPLEEHVHASWAPTTMEQEESLAKVRYENAMATREYDNSWQRKQRGMDFDTHEEPMSPIREHGEPAWPPAARMRAASIASAKQGMKSEAEPYIVSVYQEHSRHNDPVYAAGADKWQSSSYAQAQIQEQEMADRYGSIMQVRNHAEWEALNAQIANENMSVMMGSAPPNSMDETMIM